MYQSDNMDEPPMEEDNYRYNNYLWVHPLQPNPTTTIKTTINIAPDKIWRLPEVEKKVWVLVKSGSVFYEWKSFDADSWSVLTTSYPGLEGYLEIYKGDFVVGTFPKFEWKLVVLSVGRPE